DCYGHARHRRGRRRRSAGGGGRCAQASRRNSAGFSKRPAGSASAGRVGMKLADVSIRNPVFALMMSVALVTLGLFSYRSLGVDLMPKTEPPTVNVRVNLPGASPEEIETQITKPLEEALNTISDVDELKTNSERGGVSANVTFNLERNMD